MEAGRIGRWRVITGRTNKQGASRWSAVGDFSDGRKTAQTGWSGIVVPPVGRQRRISVKGREKSVYGLTAAGLLMEADTVHPLTTQPSPVADSSTNPRYRRSSRQRAGHCSV